MRAVRSAALLLAGVIWTINAQSSHNNSHPGNHNQGNSINHIDSTQTNQKQQQSKGSVSDEPISFNTKAKDACSMVISSQANFTKLRVSCKSKGKSYWCDFLGKPNLCKAYNNNPRHYFTQMMWDLRKLHNACQGPRVYKPHMCRSASDEVQMSFHASWPKISKVKPTQAPHDRNENQQKQKQTKLSSSTPKPAKQQPKPQQPAKSASKPAKTAASKPVSPRKPVKITTARPTVAEQENETTKLAEEYCWSSLQGVCSYFISLFQS
ncbi:fibroblast growth factor-binding protein 2b [Triplophysa rosa]|uniref:Fibroblast growth factor binding protein 2b n=1 Tax=Triplophysa rosa TaxID=992332 RepID=A0A9W7WYP5_TRIRA|nr:fibroblast growth factor-binding protein 2b [Triplophysa rosa]KAI7810624.1 putative fibroblast growth factor binding protein 2b [Triplophysa rosa]